MPASDEIITKPLRPGAPRSNLVDYAEAVGSFAWSDVRSELDGLPSGGINIAHECVDRHAYGPNADRLALRFVAKKPGEALSEMTYAELANASNRFANALRDLSVGAGERVFALCPRLPGLYVAALGTLKNRSVFSPLFPAFGPEPIKTRLALGSARVLVTTTSLYARKVAEIRAALPTLRHVLLIDGDGTEGLDSGVHSLSELLEAASPAFAIPPTAPEDPALLHFTSGTTGTPKGALHVHAAVLEHHITGRWVLDLHPDDVYWCTADPGWVTGTSYGIIAPLTNGVTMIVDPEEFDATRWYEILERERVSVWYTAPTAIRMLIKAGPELPRRYRLDALRFAASVGEPLNPEAVLWGERVLGLPFHDNWWQTETGGIMIANFACLPIKPGSMGKPVPGIEAASVATSADGGVEPITTPDTPGELATIAASIPGTGLPIEPGLIGKHAKFAIMIPPVSVCHQLS